MQRRVGKDIKFATEAEVLLIVRQELQMIAQVAVYIYRVLNIITIEGDCILSDRTHERILQQSHIVVVDIHICKHILERNVKDVARLDKLVYTRRALSFDDTLL